MTGGAVEEEGDGGDDGGDEKIVKEKSHEKGCLFENK